MKQLALELAAAPAPTLDNFIIGDNAEVVAALRALLLEGQPERFIYLWGGTGSGCSHLLRATLQALRKSGRAAHLFEGSADGVQADDACVADNVQRLDGPAQIALFNVCNTLREGSGVLVAAGDLPPARLPLRPDLLTRLAWGLVYEVHPLSEQDRLAALRDYAAARGFTLPQEVAEYLLARAPRDLGSLRALVDTLDRLSLEQKRAITVPLARELLQLAPRKQS
jgi:DnaA-homolog protein